MEKFVVVFPTHWDRRNLEQGPRWWGRDKYEIVFFGPEDADCEAGFDVLGFIEETSTRFAGQIAGVTSSSDYPGATVAAAVSSRMGLAGATPFAVIQSSHKYYSRIVQREAVPEATPAFWLVDPTQKEQPAQIEFPCFVKPVKGSFSMHTARIEDSSELEAFLSRPLVREFRLDYARMFSELIREYSDFEADGGYFIAEGLLRGDQVTVEGFSFQGDVEIVAVVDSVMHPQNRSFKGFYYPSRLPLELQKRMENIAVAAIRALGLDNSLFNIEMTYDEPERISIIEVNPRICGQFADLYEKVDGMNGYEMALELAAGRRPQLRRRQGQFRVAGSFPLRIFEPVEVLRAPSAAEIEEAETLFPSTIVWSECESGQILADFQDLEDGSSLRYAVINIGAPDESSLETRRAAIEEQLGYRFATC